MKDVETGQRGYVLTGDEHYLDPVEIGMRRLAWLDQASATNNARPNSINNVAAGSATRWRKTGGIGKGCGTGHAHDHSEQE